MFFFRGEFYVMHVDVGAMFSWGVVGMGSFVGLEVEWAVSRE